ncbi:MAG TPA: serine hydrolase [Roseiflexaceae bacterium]|nr:serine hydrolase [Roseiflexaceae bacterium]
MERQQTTAAVRAGDPRLPYLPGLDGLRALAVIGVVLYHAEVGLPGGFLGVEAFFALSGYLITALLLAEWRSSGQIDLAAFWKRRALRLLPALLLTLVGALICGALLLPDETESLPGDVLAALAYVMNWRLVGGEQSYFDPMLRPSLLQHLWSLAVEEQFYLIWPVLFLAGMRYLRARGLLAATLVAAVGSMVLMALLYQPDADPSRIYYGTDTRASGLLLGAALAMVWRPGAQVPAEAARGWLLDGLGLAALGGLLLGAFVLDSAHPLLYRGGLTLVAVATLVAVMAVTHPAARLMPAALGWAPLRWIGVRSYGIYLWHWPIVNVTRPYLDVSIDGLPLLLLRLTLIVALADLSYRAVELPVRHGALGRLWRAWRAPATAPELALTTSGGSAVVAHAVALPGQALAQRLRALLSAWQGQEGDSPQPTPPDRRRRGGAKSPNRPQRRAHPQRARQTRSQTTASTATGDASVQRFPSGRRWASVLMTCLLLVSTATCASTRQAQVATPVATTALTAAPASAVPAPPTAEPTTEPSPEPTAAPSATAEPTAEPSPTPMPAIDAGLAAELQRILDATVADGAISGATISVHIPGSQPWSGSSGVAARGQDVPMTPDTRVRIASISKIFTAVVVLQLAQEGKLDLEAPLSTWVPGLVPEAERITVRQLLQHTSGLYDYLEDVNFVNRAYAEPERLWKPEELVGYAVQFRASFSPGAPGRWDYSSTNYVLLGMIVERVTGNTLAVETRRRIFEPLGLASTYFPPDEAIEGAQSRGYSRQRDQTAISMSFVFGTAHIVSTPSDVRRFGEAVFGGELLEPGFQEQMLQFVSGRGSYNMPELEYGLGVMRNRLPVGPGPDGQARPAEASRVLGHIGGFGGFRSALWHAPESGITVALGVNQASTDPNILATKLFDAILTAQGR